MRILFLFAFVCCGLCGCGNTEPPDSKVIIPAGTGLSDRYAIDPNKIKFADHVESNSPVDTDLLSLEFTDQDGQAKSLKELAGGKNLILVMTRGYSGSICPYCSSQVSRLISNYDQIIKQNAQVIVVYPVASHADTFKSDEFIQRVLAMTSAKKNIPFPILLDVELKGVDLLRIRKDLSKPATYILDSEGRIQLAYVGNTLADRPSVQALIEQLEKINSRSAGG